MHQLHTTSNFLLSLPLFCGSQTTVQGKEVRQVDESRGWLSAGAEEYGELVGEQHGSPED